MIINISLEIFKNSALSLIYLSSKPKLFQPVIKSGFWFLITSQNFIIKEASLGRVYTYYKDNIDNIPYNIVFNTVWYYIVFQVRRSHINILDFY